MPDEIAVWINLTIRHVKRCMTVERLELVSISASFADRTADRISRFFYCGKITAKKMTEKQY